MPKKKPAKKKPARKRKPVEVKSNGFGHLTIPPNTVVRDTSALDGGDHVRPEEADWREWGDE